MKKFLLIFSLLPLSVFSQHNQCRDIRGLIKEFTVDTVVSFNSDPSVSRNILPSIKKSDSDIEIRFYENLNIRNFIGPIITIKCAKNIVTAQRYGIQIKHILDTMTLPKGYVNIGPLDGDAEKNVFLYKENDLKPEGTWKEFFTKLVENNFFTLKREEEIERIVRSLDPYAQSSGHGTSWYFEMKLEDSFQNVRYTRGFPNLPPEIKEYEYLERIFKLFHNLKQLKIK